MGAARVQHMAGMAAAAAGRGGSGRGATVASATVVAVLMGGLLADWVPREMHLRLRRFPTLAEVPPAHRWLAAHGSGRPLLEVPVRRGGFAAAEAQARAQYFSSVHWLPLLGGYSGYRPAFLDVYADLGALLPATKALQTLVNIVDVGWILVHTGELSPARREEWSRPAGLEEVARFGDDVVFRVALAPSADWRGHLRSLGSLGSFGSFGGRARESTTFAGLPLAPVPPDGRVASIEASLAADSVPPRHAVVVSARVKNPTPVPWPCFAVRLDGAVQLWSRWLAADGSVVGEPVGARLLEDLRPGEQAAVTVVTWSPQEPGRYALELGVGQGTAGAPGSWRAGARRLEVEVTADPTSPRTPQGSTGSQE
jgi:hypothetical protein